MNKEEWGNKQALQENLAKQIACLEIMGDIQKKLHQLRIAETSLRETIGE